MRSTVLLFKHITALLLIALVSVGIIGVSYAYFSEWTSVKTTAIMGSCDVAFSDLYINDSGFSDSACSVDARIIDGGKNIELTITNASPGCTATIEYEVINNGTVPVSYQLGQAVDNGPVVIAVSADADYIAPNGTGQGQIKITIKEEIEDVKSCGINVALSFQQAPVVS